MTAQRNHTPGVPRLRRLAGRVTALLTLVVLLANAALVVHIASLARVRLDATAAGEHRLAPRTRAILDQLKGEHEIIIAAGPLIVRDSDVRDVLDAFAAASRNVRVTLIDASASDGPAQRAAALARVIERSRAEIDAYAASAESLASAASDAAERLANLARALDASASNVADVTRAGDQLRQYLAERAAGCRNDARVLGEAASRARAAASTRVLDLDLPAADAALDAIRPALEAVASGLSRFADEASQIAAAAGVPEPAPRDLPGVSREASSIRDALAAALDRASRVPTPDALRVARVLERSPAALIVAPPREDSTAPNTAAHTPRVTAVPLERLFPPTDLSAGAVRADVKRNAESLLASALGVVSSDAPPIVVFVHAALEDMLAPNAPIVKLAERLALRGIDTLEWRVESGASNPSTASPSTPSQSSESDPGAAPAGTLPGDAALRTALASLDPSGARPVVYAIVPSPSQAPGGIERAHALSRALRSVLASDAPVLVSLLPSSLPSIGQGDPVAASLASYGVKADTARPILGDVATTQGRVVASDHEVAPADTDQPIARALRGLPLMLPWPVPLDPPAGWDALLTLERQGEGRALWGESEWIAYASIPNDQKSLVPDPPRPDAARDDVRDAFIVAAAGRRRDAQTDAISASNAAGGRTIVVSSGWWMLDRVALAEQRIENRTSLVWPGNAELFEACVDWLAGHDALIAQGVQARAVARIEPIDPQTLSRLRWGVLAGLPLLTLVLGGLWRLIRG